MAIEFVKKISVIDTLRSMAIGESSVFTEQDANSSSLRSAACRLNKKGCRFIVSNSNVNSGVRVFRIK